MKPKSPSVEVSEGWADDAPDTSPAITGDYEAKPNDFPNFYNIPTEDNAPLVKGKNINFVPHWMEKLYDNTQVEKEALNKALGGEYKSEFFFGGTVRDAFMADDIGRSGTIDDKQKKFRAAYPDGETQTIPYNGKLILVGRKSPAENWTKFGYLTDELIPEVASFATAGAALGESIGARGIPGLGKIPIVGAPLGAGVGFVAGKALDLGLESLKGYGKENTLASKETALGAGLNTAFSFISRGMLVGGLIAKATEQGAIPPLAKKAIEFAGKEKLPEIMRGQVSTNPTVQQVFGQVTALNEKTQLNVIQQNLAASEKLLEFATRNNFAGVEKKALQGLIDKERFNLDTLLTGIKRREIAPEEASLLLQKSFANWETLVDGKGGHLDSLYKSAIAASDDIAFDLSETQSKVRALRSGVVGKGVPTEVPSKILDAKGKPASTISVPGDEVKVTEDPQGALGQAMDALLSLDPIVTKNNAKNGSMFSSFEIMKELRTRFRRLGESSDPGVAGPAKRIHGILTGNMERGYNTGGDATKTAAFQNLWKEASKQYRAFNDLSELKIISKITNMEEGDYSQVINNLLIPGKSEALKLIGNVVPDGQNILQSVFATRLLAGSRSSGSQESYFVSSPFDPPFLGLKDFSWTDTITKELDKFVKANDQEGLDYLLPKKDRAYLEAYARGMDKLENSNLGRIAVLDRDASATASEIVKSSTPEDLKYIMDLAGGKNTPQGEAITAGLLTRLYKDSIIKIKTHGDGLDYDKFRKGIQDLEDKGVASLMFSKDQIEFLKNLDSYVNVVQMRGNFGASLQAGEQAGAQIRYPVEAPKAVLDGNVLQKTYKVFVLPVSAEVAGRFLGKPVNSKFGSTAGFRKVSAIKWASRGLASMVGNEPAREEPSMEGLEFTNPGAFPKFKDDE